MAWELAYRERWQKPLVEGTPLSRGVLFHEVMDNYYQRKRILDGDASLTDSLVESVYSPLLDKLFDLLSLNDLDNQSDEQRLVQWMYEGYCELYETDPDWEIVEVEKQYEFWLPTANGGRSNFKIKMKIDLLARNKRTGQLWLWDHKTCKDLSKSDKGFQLDDQFGLYLWGLRQLGLNVIGAIRNECRTFQYKDKNAPYPLDTRFKRIMLYRTDEELDAIAIEAYKTARRAWVQTPADTAERTPDSDTCQWRCDFTEDCLGSRKAGLNGQKAYQRRSLRLHGYEQNFVRH